MTRGSHNVIVTVTRPELAPGQSFAEWLAAHPAEAADYRNAVKILAVVVAHAAETSATGNAGSTPAALPPAHLPTLADPNLLAA